MYGANLFLYQISIVGDVVMLYLDAFFANLNMVVRIADYLSCGKDDVWADDRAEFGQNKFYYVTKGTCVITIAGKKYYGKEGTCFFIPANTRHAYRNVKGAPFEKFWFHFDLYPNSSIFQLLNLNYSIHTKDDAIFKLFEELTAKYESDTITDRLDVKSLAMKILSSYIDASHKTAKVASPDSEEKISGVLSYIDEKIATHISNLELSELCYQHPNHFVRFFKKKTGLTPQKYITERRVQMAKRLIEQTDLKFTDIAAQVGFCDAPHLSKVFKKYYSLTPQEYRKVRDRQKI